MFDGKVSLLPSHEALEATVGVLVRVLLGGGGGGFLAILDGVIGGEHVE